MTTALSLRKYADKYRETEVTWDSSPRWHCRATLFQFIKRRNEFLHLLVHTLRLFYLQHALCGLRFLAARVPNKSVTHKQVFRPLNFIVYGTPAEPLVTGVGCYDGNASWKAPSDPAARWDRTHLQSSQEIPVMRQRPCAGLHGFVLHDACWRLLREACKPGTIPLGRLLAMCESLPFPLGALGVCWGHDYGRLLQLDTQKHYPWQEQFDCLFEDLPASAYVGENPFDIPGLAGIMSESTPPLTDGKTLTSARDCFSQLPWEIRTMIACLLPTNDALNLRLACKSFLHLYYSCLFWSSRFKADNERGFLFEFRGCKDVMRLLRLYENTVSSRCLPALTNRQRIWRLGRQLVNIARQSRGDESGNPKLQIAASLEWIRLAGDEQVEKLTEGWKPFERGCRPIHTITVAVPKQLKKIGITLISLGALDYITGIRFLAEKEPDVYVGYRSDGDEILYPLQGLRGFRLAVGPGGIRALQIIDHDGCSFPWIGRAAGTPVSERLTGFGFLAALRVTIDVRVT